MEQKNTTFYRPEWTCGRHAPMWGAAIFYNLLEGLTYFFEDLSAGVVGFILSKPRNGQFTLNELVEASGIADESLAPFLEQLLQANLITDTPPTKEGVAEYRRRLSEYKCSVQQQPQTTKEKLPMVVTNAEMAYTERVGGITSVMFELTYNCSERCIHCYNPGATRNDNEVSHRGDRKELTLEEYKRIIDELYDCGLIKVCLSGGDPFSKSIVWDIIDYLYQKGIAFDIFTNGQRIMDKVERLADYYPRLVGVSVYSAEAADHDYITRVPGSWERSIEVVQQLSALAVPMTIKCCVMRTNAKSYHGVASLARKYGAVPQFEVSVSDSVEGDTCVSQHLRLAPEQYEVILRDANVPLYVGPEAPNFGGQKRPMDQNGCGAGENTFCITPDGLMIPCCSFHMVLGDLTREKVVDVFQNERTEWWTHLTLEQYEECGRHDYCDYCNLCPGLGFSEHGTPLKAAENCCFVAKTRYNLAKKMMNEDYDPLQGQSLATALQALPDMEKEELNRIIGRSTCDTIINR